MVVRGGAGSDLAGAAAAAAVRARRNIFTLRFGSTTSRPGRSCCARRRLPRLQQMLGLLQLQLHRQLLQLQQPQQLPTTPPSSAPSPTRSTTPTLTNPSTSNPSRISSSEARQRPSNRSCCIWNRRWDVPSVPGPLLPARPTWRRLCPTGWSGRWSSSDGSGGGWWWPSSISIGVARA